MLLSDNCLERFRALAAEDPRADAFTCVTDPTRPARALTRAEILAKTDAISGFLRLDAGLEPGDRAVLVYPPGADFMRALAGCVAAGVVPVPVCPPNPFNLGHDMPAFARVVADCGARVALTNRAYRRGRRWAASKGSCAVKQ